MLYKMQSGILTSSDSGPDEYTIFQVQSNDIDSSTDFVDDVGATVTAVDNVHHDNVQAKFGTTSIYCDGTDDEITIPDNPAYAIGSAQAFTWEWWLYTNGTPANNTHCAGQGTATAATFAWFARFNTGGTLTIGTSNGTTQRLITCTTDLSSAWHHIALIHTGVELFLHIDGVEEGTSIAHTDAVNNVSDAFEFGGGNQSASHINAWFESMRLSNIDRYGGGVNFTAPSARF